MRIRESISILFAFSFPCTTLATVKWTAGPGLPISMRDPAAAVVDGKIYVTGGWWGLKDVVEYDPGSNTWNTRADMLTGRDGHGAAAVNGKIYAIGGQDGATAFSSVEEYDPATDTWMPKTSMSATRYHLAIAEVDG